MASHIWRARTVRESKKPGKHTWRARHEKKKNTAMHILWLSCAWKPGNYGPNSCLSRVAFWWNRNDATNFFYAFAARDSIVQIPVFFFFLSIFAQILRRFALGFFSFLVFFSRISTLTVPLLFPAPLPGRFFFNLSRKRLEIFLVFKILLLVPKRFSFPSQFFFFFFFEDLASNLL